MKLLTTLGLFILFVSSGFSQERLAKVQNAQNLNIIIKKIKVPLTVTTNTNRYANNDNLILLEEDFKKEKITGELPRAYLNLHHLQEVHFKNYAYYTVIPIELANTHYPNSI